MGRNLATLQAEFGTQARESFQKMAESSGTTTVSATPKSVIPAKAGIHTERAKPAASTTTNNITLTGLTSWTFGELPELLEIAQGKLTLIGFPALVDKGSHCDLEVTHDGGRRRRAELAAELDTAG